MISRCARCCVSISILLCVTVGLGLAGPLVVTPTGDATTMVNALLAPLSGISIVAGSQVYVGASAASGLFTGGTGILPFDSGVILTTGEAGFVVGPNKNPDTSNGNLALGDADLGTVAGANTTNASILQFSFIPIGNTISFQFVFGSEEYNEFVDSEFNDTFAVFLNGVNIALIPGTSDAITVNRVNNNLNSQFYTDNDVHGENPPATTVDTELDGLVGVKMALFAVGNVNPGVVNTLKIGIADAYDVEFDADWDSAVFLKGLVSAEAPPNGVIPEPSTWLLLGGGLVLIGATKRFRRT